MPHSSAPARSITRLMRSQRTKVEDGLILIGVLALAIGMVAIIGPGQQRRPVQPIDSVTRPDVHIHVAVDRRTPDVRRKSSSPQ